MRLEIDQKTAASMIRKSNGSIFEVTFVKRSNGESRTMRARTGVKKGITGAGLKFDPAKRGLIPVYTMAGDDVPQNRRFVSIEGITKLRIGGSTFHVVRTLG